MGAKEGQHPPTHPGVTAPASSFLYEQCFQTASHFGSLHLYKPQGEKKNHNSFIINVSQNYYKVFFLN